MHETIVRVFITGVCRNPVNRKIQDLSCGNSRGFSGFPQTPGIQELEEIPEGFGQSSGGSFEKSVKPLEFFLILREPQLIFKNNLLQMIFNWFTTDFQLIFH